MSAAVSAASGQTVWPGYALPPGAYAAPAIRRTTHNKLLLQLGVGVGVLIIVAVVAFAFLTPTPTRIVCPPDCGPPPFGTPVERLPRYTSANGDFTVSYPIEGSAYRVTTKPNGIVAEFTAGDGGTMQLFGVPALGRSPQDIAASLINETYPDAKKAYEIPNAMLGYQLGYGMVADYYPQDASGKFTRLRVLVMVAMKNGLALVATAVGPYHQFTPSFSTGQPSAANFQLALDMAKYVNSFTWRGDPLR